MELTVESTFGLVSMGPILVAFLVSLWQYLKHRYRNLLYLTLMWALYFTWCLVSFASKVLLNETLFWLGGVVFMPIAFLATLWVDSIEIEAVDPVKLVFVAILSSVLFVFSLSPDAIILVTDAEGGSYFKINTSETLLGFLLLNLYIVVIFVYIQVKLHLNAPPDVKSASKAALAGITFMGSGVILYYLLGLNTLLPGANFLFAAVGAFLMAIGFRNPKLPHLLSFKALRLIVINTREGTGVFAHTWNEVKEVSENLVAGMIHGVNQFIDEITAGGQIREIMLDRYLFLLERSEEAPVLSMLMVTRSTRSLRQALQAFTAQFSLQFGPVLAEPVVNLKKLEPAKNLVDQCFPFVPRFSVGSSTLLRLPGGEELELDDRISPRQATGTPRLVEGGTL